MTRYIHKKKLAPLLGLAMAAAIVTAPMAQAEIYDTTPRIDDDIILIYPDEAHPLKVARGGDNVAFVPATNEEGLQCRRVSGSDAFSNIYLLYGDGCELYVESEIPAGTYTERIQVIKNSGKADESVAFRTITYVVYDQEVENLTKAERDFIFFWRYNWNIDVAQGESKNTDRAETSFPDEVFCRPNGQTPSWATIHNDCTISMQIPENEPIGLKKIPFTSAYRDNSTGEQFIYANVVASGKSTPEDPDQNQPQKTKADTARLIIPPFGTAQDPISQGKTYVGSVAGLEAGDTCSLKTTSTPWVTVSDTCGLTVAPTKATPEGKHTAEVTVTFSDGSTKTVDVSMFVKKSETVETPDDNDQSGDGQGGDGQGGSQGADNDHHGDNSNDEDGHQNGDSSGSSTGTIIGLSIAGILALIAGIAAYLNSQGMLPRI